MAAGRSSTTTLTWSIFLIVMSNSVPGGRSQRVATGGPLQSFTTAPGYGECEGAGEGEAAACRRGVASSFTSSSSAAARTAFAAPR